MKNQLKPFYKYLVVFTLGLACGYYSLPAKIETKTEIQIIEKEKIVYKERTEKKEDRDKVIIITEETKPDGTKIIRKEIRDKSQIDTSKNKEGETTKEKETNEKHEETIEYSKDSLYIGLNGAVDILKPSSIVYGIQLNRRLFGPTWIGTTANTQQEVGLTIGLSF